MCIGIRYEHSGSAFGSTAKRIIKSLVVSSIVLLALPQVLRAQFAHVAAGGEYQTVVIFANEHSVAVSGSVSLYGDDGSGLYVHTDGDSDYKQTIPVSLDAGEVRRMVLHRETLLAGWLDYTFSPQTPAISVVIQYIPGGTMVSETGVLPAALISSAFLAVDNELPALNNGLALANRSSTENRTVNLTLWNPTTGASLATASLTLPPRGHVGRLVTELFPSVSGIDRMRAQISLSVTGGSILAMALRINRGIMSTLPINTSLLNSSSVGEILPQAAFGGPPESNLKTVVYMTTAQSNAVSGTMSFYNDDGQPLYASVDGAPGATSHAFTVGSRRVQRFVLSGDTAVGTGWIRITFPSSPSSFNLNSIVQTWNGTQLLSESGVTPARAARVGMVAISRQSSEQNVGVALVNAGTASNNVKLILRDVLGRQISESEITLGAFAHVARFATELFPIVAADPGFQGTITINGTTSVGAAALRFSGTTFTAVPVGNSGMYRPTITAVRVISTVKSPITVTVEFDAVDLDADLGTSGGITITAISGSSISIVFGSTTFTTVQSSGGGTMVTMRGSMSTSLLSCSSVCTAPVSVSVSDKAGNPSASGSATATFQ